MNKTILECHNFLTNIYNEAEKLLKDLLDLSYEASLDSYNNHYISIDNTLVNQKYYMPVISIKNKGDICFNLDGIQFEFYVTKEELLNNVDLDNLLLCYKDILSIYEFEDCTKDLFQIGIEKNKLILNVKNSKDSKFGIAINCNTFSHNELIKNFDKVCNLLNF